MARKQPVEPEREEPGLIDQLKDAIRQSGRTLYRLSKESGIGHDRLSRFVRGERGLSLEAADAIFRTLGLRVTPTAQQTSPTTESPTKPPPASPAEQQPQTKKPRKKKE